MNTANIKKYAPLARNAFITAVTKRANELGIYADHIEEAVEEGQVLKIEGRSVDLKLKGARNKLIQRVDSAGFTALMEFIAYTWFNRLCAIRYMELHDYLDHGLRVLSHPDNDNGFEILEHAQDVADDLGLNRDQIIELKLAGNQDELLYRTLLLGQCHALHKAMPFLFEAIDDETELLLPDNLTRTDSILRGLINDIPAEDWQQVEVIGWLYQFYISEKKDQVIGKVVKSDDIPAATQLFTPNWIVKYLVQNSVGRQWLQTYPDSSLKAQMEYYIEPAEQTEAVNVALAAQTPDSIDPEKLKILDPACGSGHILVEAYHTLKAIYEERGYRNREIPQLILENNLFGLDIDDRAAQLSGFALMMLARADDRRIFSRDVQLNVMSLRGSTEWLADSQQQWYDLKLQGQSQQGENQDLFSQQAIDHPSYTLITQTLALFEQAKTFGSLIQVPEAHSADLNALLSQLKSLAKEGESTIQKNAAQKLLPYIQQACLLVQKYDAVVANPPYIGGKGMNPELKAFAKKHFPDVKSDVFAMFIIRNLEFAKDNGQLGFMTPFVWVFISSYEKLRDRLITEEIISTLIQLEYSGFDGATVPICTFTLTKGRIPDYTGSYIKLSAFKGHKNQAPKTLEAINNRDCGWFHEAKPDDFKKIPSSPIAYWVSDKVREIFNIGKPLSSYASIGKGLDTGDNNRFLRNWFEVNLDTKKWIPCQKGGAFRKWYGNNDFYINWENEGEELKSYKGSNLRNSHNYFRSRISWTRISSSSTAFRFFSDGYIFESTGPCLFPNEISVYVLASFLNSNLTFYFLRFIAPTLDFQSGHISSLPILGCVFKEINWEGLNLAKKAINMSKTDWNTYETSWDFQNNPLINTVDWVGDSVTQQSESPNAGLRDKATNPAYATDSLAERYAQWQAQNHETIAEMQSLEQENNRLFIDAYGLQDELTPEVPLEQITLTVNPKYRYGGKLSEEALENRFQSDTLAELISYAIGCMMGRYRLDKAGLIYAHAGNKDFSTIYNAQAEPIASVSDSVTQQVEATNGGLRDKAAKPSDAENPFLPDDDGIIPLTDQEWFADDATLRISEFVRAAWGEENQQQNLGFIAESLGLYAIKPKNSETSLDAIRRYLSTQFYKDHLKTYKKRPIYWLFSSGKQKAFECLVYLHRYNESTLSRMRTEYVTPLLGKYESSAMVLQKQIEEASSTAEANRHKKALIALEKKQTELSEFDDKLKHAADMRISLDLDDGVKVNYGKFGDLLADVKAVTGVKA